MFGESANIGRIVLILFVNRERQQDVDGSDTLVLLL